MNMIKKIIHCLLNVIFILGWLGFVGFVLMEIIFFVPALFRSIDVGIRYWVWFVCFMVICIVYPCLFLRYYKRFFVLKVATNEKFIILFKCVWLAVVMLLWRNFLLWI